MPNWQKICASDRTTIPEAFIRNLKICLTKAFPQTHGYVDSLCPHAHLRKYTEDGQIKDEYRRFTPSADSPMVQVCRNTPNGDEIGRDRHGKKQRFRQYIKCLKPLSSDGYRGARWVLDCVKAKERDARERAE